MNSSCARTQRERERERERTDKIIVGGSANFAGKNGEAALRINEAATRIRTIAVVEIKSQKVASHNRDTLYRRNESH